MVDRTTELVVFASRFHVPKIDVDWSISSIRIPYWWYINEETIVPEGCGTMQCGPCSVLEVL